MSDSDRVFTELLDNPSFVRWVKGEAGPRETETWDLWEAEHPVHTELKRRAKIYLNLPFEERRHPDTGVQLSRLNRRINLEQPGEGQRYSPGYSRNRTGYRRYAAAAVILLAAAVSVFTIYFESLQNDRQSLAGVPAYNRMEVGYGEKGTLKMSDGSEITINSNSTLRYSPDQFQDSMVEVWLEGEAYFSITNRKDEADRNRTFVVHTSQGDIRVVGTAFNVNTRFNRTGVALVEGRVQVSLRDSVSNESRDSVLLQPGEHALLAAYSNSISVESVNPSMYTAWLEEEMLFEDTPLSEIVRNIEAIYGVTIEFENDSLGDRSVSGALSNPDLEALLLGLEKTLAVEIRKQNQATYRIFASQNPD